MLLRTLFVLSLCINAYALDIINKPLIFNEERIKLTKEYIKQHYNLNVKNITIVPKIIVIHHTGLNRLEASFKKMMNTTLSSDRTYISKSGLLNVSAHYMIDTDGTVYQLMPDNFMARHVIGLNYSTIGIENVGGEEFEDNLTQQQLQANIELIAYLKNKYQTIEYLIGHYEYQQFSTHPLWLEQDSNYRTKKYDPSLRFMKELRNQLTQKTDLIFKSK